MAKCRICKRKIPEFIGSVCTYCEHIIGEAQADIAVEFSATEVVV